MSLAEVQILVRRLRALPTAVQQASGFLDQREIVRKATWDELFQSGAIEVLIDVATGGDIGTLQTKTQVLS